MENDRLGRGRFLLTTPLIAAAATGIAAAAPQATSGTHRLVMSVTENNAAVMNLTLNNAANASSYFDGEGQQLQVEIVAYGPGLNMFREDTSPVKARLADFKAGMPNVTFSACDNTLKTMEKAEGKPIQIVSEAHIVPAGVVRLIELEEQGWSYVRP
jgi:intracellular sulfur oxidation DsrE/DsrF family protein